MWYKQAGKAGCLGIFMVHFRGCNGPELLKTLLPSSNAVACGVQDYSLGNCGADTREYSFAYVVFDGG